jgi:hypothetical protein
MVVKQGDNLMKIRRLLLVSTMVLLAMAMVVVPVQAGKIVTPFKCHLNFFDPDPPVLPEVKQTGGVWHFVFVSFSMIESDETKLDGGMLVATFKTIDVPANPHNLNNGWPSGPWPSTWRITFGDRPGTGWEGTGQSKPGSAVFRFTGNGFGEYKNMHIVWTYVENSFVGTGEISELSK